MVKHVLMPAFCGCLLLLYGCETIQDVNPFQPHLDNRSEIEKLLPPTIKMDSIVCSGSDWKERRTVEQQLINMQAHVKDRKICDATGREIFFTTVYSGSTSPRDYKLTINDMEELYTLQTRHQNMVVVITVMRPGEPGFNF